MEDFRKNYISLKEHVGTRTPFGKLFFGIFASLAEFERNLIRERTMIGLEAARSRGRLGGRKHALSERERKELRTLYDSRQYAIADLTERFGISKPTLYKYVK